MHHEQWPNSKYVQGQEKAPVTVCLPHHRFRLRSRKVAHRQLIDDGHANQAAAGLLWAPLRKEGQMGRLAVHP